MNAHTNIPTTAAKAAALAQADANACAPELIECLQSLMRFEPYFAGEREWADARAAIAKARGDMGSSGENNHG